MFFGFESNREISLLGKSFNLYCYVGIYDAKIKDIILSENQTKLEFENIDEKHKSYIVIKYFISEDEMSKYIEDINGEEVAELSNAKSIIEYLENENREI